MPGERRDLSDGLGPGLFQRQCGLDGHDLGQRRRAGRALAAEPLQAEGGAGDDQGHSGGGGGQPGRPASLVAGLDKDRQIGTWQVGVLGSVGEHTAEAGFHFVDHSLLASRLRQMARSVASPRAAWLRTVPREIPSRAAISTSPSCS